MPCLGRPDTLLVYRIKLNVFILSFVNKDVNKMLNIIKVFNIERQNIEIII